MTKKIKRAAQALGHLGGRKGGINRALALSPKRRAEIASIAGKARWKNHNMKKARLTNEDPEFLHTLLEAERELNNRMVIDLGETKKELDKTKKELDQVRQEFTDQQAAIEDLRALIMKTRDANTQNAMAQNEPFPTPIVPDGTAGIP